MDRRNEQYERAYRTARDIGQQFGRTSNGHFWGRIILKLFEGLLEQDDEFLVESRVNGLVEQYVAGSAWDYPGGRADFMHLLLEQLEELRQYPTETAKAAIEGYLHPPSRARHRQTGRH
ncbi:MAG: hypothetical protein FJ280_17025 [Planctomycetes bacterium]|nr:hypothetical protein [Planctomycetota bacterium]